VWPPKAVLAVAAGAAALGALAGLPPPARGQNDETVVIGVPNWPSARATANIIKVVIEDRLGLAAEIREMASPDIFAGMDSGEVHVHPEAWLPNYAELTAEYVEGRGTVRQSPNSVVASQGICTTRQTAEELDLQAVSDLADPTKAVFFDTDHDVEGELWIGEATWTSTAIEKIRARSYGYDRTMELLEAPEEVAMATIDASIAVGKPVVFYCYQPHYLTQLHDIVMLEEPAHDPAHWQIVLPEHDPEWLERSEASVAWGPSQFQIDYAASLEAERPEVAALLGSIAFDRETVAAMGYALVVERQDPYAFAKAWVESNAEVVDSWLEDAR
jgi:glycine betaine/proline transport system substrate-binding protein